MQIRNCEFDDRTALLIISHSLGPVFQPLSRAITAPELRRQTRKQFANLICEVSFFNSFRVFLLAAGFWLSALGALLLNARSDSGRQDRGHGHKWFARYS